MRTAKTMGLVVALFAIGGASVSSAMAEKVLTFYANGEPVQVGPPFSDPFELTTTSPVAISIPATGVSISCPSEPIVASLGWFESNGQTTDVVGTNGYAAGPVRECSGMIFSGLLLDGTLHFSSNGNVVMGRNELLEHSPEFELDGCRFAGDLRSKMALPGPLITTLRGKMHSHKPGCAAFAEVKVGPLEGLFESNLVEGRLSP